MEYTAQQPAGLSEEKIVAFLRDGHPLLSTERAHIRSAIPDLRATLHQHSIRLQALKSVLRVFESEHAYVGAKLQKYEAVFAPIQHVPDDVLLEIFRLCLPLPIEDDVFYPNINVRWQLTKVCHAWRELVHNTPSLWESVVIQNHPDFVSNRYTLHRYLEMSGQHPLRVVFEDGAGKDDMCPIANILFKTSSRWKVLCMQFKIETFAQETSKVVDIYRKFNKTTIEELYLTLSAKGSPYDFPQALENFQSFLKHTLPKFTSLRRADLPGSSFAQFTPVGLPRTVTHFKAPSYAQALHHLKAMPNLIELHFAHNHCASQSTNSLPAVRHDTLRVLRMCKYFTLDNLTLPALGELTVGLDPNLIRSGANRKPCVVDPTHLDSLASFIERSRCRLKSLVLLDPSLMLDQRLISDVLDPLSDSLVSLGLSLVPTDPECACQLRRMVRRPDVKGPAPRLKYLELKLALVAVGQDAANQDMLQAISELIISRCDPLIAAKWGTAVLKGVRTHLYYREFFVQLEEMCVRELGEFVPVFDRAVHRAYSDTVHWEGPGWADRTSLAACMGVWQDEFGY
ncbi:hypothetical protein CYLTODRAFT_490422 [Cylindrobasidium torrendii FP15055 ss-10]|uniref:F-box domain-containing protein n=1 Tax=Cylindrobasidium torrendii FP15055 ss-10 TaxID=1314674 RepID=A0A0D7BBN5_9AGAR|nr:hypothetical protein CYLTODRAFT_490422 [Cylindrobasidium torrendii FP15055 ss-10]